MKENSKITKEEYILTNLHPRDGGYYIRLKDNKEYPLYFVKKVENCIIT